MSRAQFDEIIHAPNRLRICAALSVVDSADFAAIREVLGVSDSVLSKHIKALGDAGYVSVAKTVVGAHVRTSLALTIAGRRAYRHHVEALRELVLDNEPLADAPR